MKGIEMKRMLATVIQMEVEMFHESESKLICAQLNDSVLRYARSADLQLLTEKIVRRIELDSGKP